MINYLFITLDRIAHSILCLRQWLNEIIRLTIIRLNWYLVEAVSTLLNTLFASYNTIMLNTGPYHGTFDTIVSIISLIMSTIVVVLFVLYSFSLVCWVTYLIRDCRKSNRSASRIESLEEIFSPEIVVIVKNYRFNAKKDKILIILILTEALAFFQIFSLIHIILSIISTMISTGLGCPLTPLVFKVHRNIKFGLMS